MLDPNPSIADLDAMLDRHRNDDAAMEKIIRGYLRCAIYSYQKHCVRRALRHIGKDDWSFKEEDVAALRAEGAKSISDFRDWLIEELAGMGLPGNVQSTVRQRTFRADSDAGWPGLCAPG